MDLKYKVALKFGLIFSISFILKNFILVSIGMEKLLLIENLYKFIVILGLGIFLCYRIVQILKFYGFDLIFKNIFSTIFLMWITAVFISCIFDFLFYNYMFFDFSLKLKEFSIQRIQDMKESFNISNDSELQKSITELKETNIYSLMNILKGFVFSIPSVAILCSIISIIFKK